MRQQFDVAAQISAAGLVPIIEPEVDIHCPDKAEAEEMLTAALLGALNALPAEQLVMLKLTLPERDDGYAACVRHPNVVRVVALSGGYTRDEANRRLRRSGIVARLSRALVEGLTAQQSDTEFNARLDAYVQSICGRQHLSRRCSEHRRGIGQGGDTVADEDRASGDQYDPYSRDGRGAAGQLRPSGDADGARARGLLPVAARPAL